MVELVSDNMLESDEIGNVDFQKTQIQMALKEPMLLGQVWYVIDASWFKLFKCFVGLDTTLRCGDPVDPGPINNSSLLDPLSGNMKTGLVEGLDFVTVPSSAWDLLSKWYGVKDEHTIEINVINVATFPQIEPRLEIYKIELKLFDNSEYSKPVTFSFSRCDKISKIETFCRKIFIIPTGADVQLRGVFGPNKFNFLDKNKTVQEESLSSDIKIVCEVLDDKPKSLITSEPSVVKGPPRIPMVIPGQGLVYKNLSDGASSAEGRGSPCTPGLSGLANLGNTCFMNSIIQCLSNCRPITKYFLDRNHEREINTSNPLGKAGQIANSFADVISTIWSGKHSVTVPRYFKIQLTHFAPQFAGFRQHDAQELLTFLLDGLHEDLNRVKDKPYCQVEESEHEEDHELARKSWEYFLSRNDSIIIDNFHGMLKSRVVCPDCGKVSVKFDTFSSISLPLPLSSSKTLTMKVRYVPYDQVLKERDISIAVPKNGSIRDVALELSKTTEVRADRMIIAEVFKSHFHKFFSMDDPIDFGIENSNMLHMYDLPEEMVDDSDQRYTIAPVALWEVDNSARLKSNAINFFGTPFLLVLPRGPITRSSLYTKIRERMIRSWNGPFKSTLEYDSLIEVPGESNNSSLGVDNLFFPVLVNAFSYENVKSIHFDDQGVFKVPESFGRDFIALKIQKQVRQKCFKESFPPYEASREIRSKSRKFSLENCVSLFTTTERLGENNTWHCPRCNKKKRATKKLDLWKLPNILILHLKRFLFNETRREKLDLEIEFPLTGLNIDQYVINKEEENFTYDLIGVCNHYGSLMCGHYTASCKNYNDGKWYCFDDSSVYPISAESVQTQHAYVLFYQRRVTTNP